MFSNSLKRFSIVNIVYRNISSWEEAADVLRSMVQKRKPFHIAREKVLFGNYEDDYYKYYKADVDHTFKRLKFFDDTLFGGQSYCSLETLQENDQQIFRLKGKLQRSTIVDADTNKSFGRPTRKCYCAMKGWFREVQDLNDQQGLTITLRTLKPIKFKINLKTESFIDDELFQLPCEIEGSPDWHTFHIPFIAFNHVREGQVSGLNRIHDNMSVEGIGFLFDDEAPDQASWKSEFQLDIKKISAPVMLDVENIRQHLPELIPPDRPAPQLVTPM